MDNSQVVTGTATPEYQDAVKFFARDYITEGMRLLQYKFCNGITPPVAAVMSKNSEGYCVCRECNRERGGDIHG